MAEKVTVRAGENEQYIHEQAAKIEGLTPGRWRRKTLLDKGLAICKKHGVSVDKPTIRKYGEDK